MIIGCTDVPKPMSDETKAKIAGGEKKVKELRRKEKDYRSQKRESRTHTYQPKDDDY